MPELCSLDAAVISPMMSETRRTLATISSIVVPASCTSLEPASTLSTEVPISALISLAASALRCASERTSEATTAKPRPCSPARAASTAALSARMLVWKAMPSITPMMSAIFLLDAVISSIVDTTCVTTSPPRCATAEADDASWLAWLAASALWRTVPVSCAIELAVCCRLLAVCSVRAERSALPCAISVDAVEMLSVEFFTCATMRARLPCMSSSDCISSAVSSRPSTCSCSCDRSPSAMRRASRVACSIGAQIERSVSTITIASSAMAAMPSTAVVVDCSRLLRLTSSRAPASSLSACLTSASMLLAAAAMCGVACSA